MAQFPDPIREGIERVELQLEFHQILVSSACLGACDPPTLLEAPEDVYNFNEDQLRSTQGAILKNILSPAALVTRVEKCGDDDR